MNAQNTHKIIQDALLDENDSFSEDTIEFLIDGILARENFDAREISDYLALNFFSPRAAVRVASRIITAL